MGFFETSVVLHELRHRDFPNSINPKHQKSQTAEIEIWSETAEIFLYAAILLAKF